LASVYGEGGFCLQARIGPSADMSGRELGIQRQRFLILYGLSKDIALAHPRAACFCS
jgi:hypothetical protein